MLDRSLTLCRWRSIILSMTSTVVLRPAVTTDDQRLRDLAGLDSTRLPAGPFLVGEVDGTVVAALSTSDGVAIADPFTFTAGVVDLLREHAAATAPARARRLRPRLAFS
jgi:hypothetical protein